MFLVVTDVTGGEGKVNRRTGLVVDKEEEERKVHRLVWYNALSEGGHDRYRQLHARHPTQRYLTLAASCT